MITTENATHHALAADPLPTLIYEGEYGAVSCTMLRFGHIDAEWYIEYARYTMADKYDAGWRYLGTVPSGQVAALIINHYLNGNKYA